ncbi:hypothetical protein V8F06_010060 [Rhypophila decipiens]
MSDKNLPITTEDDLRKLGLTPEILRAKFESRGWVITGKTHGFYLPKDHEWGKELALQCRNTVLQQWTVVDQQLPVPGQKRVYNQTFENFESETPADFNFTNDTTVTTGTDYSLTTSFDISVNLGLNLGAVGHLNINAGMSQQEVQQFSKTETKAHTVNFNVTCPAHGGKLVGETTTEYTAKTTFESKIGPVGTVCLATRDPNMYYIFYDINYIFPELYQTGRVVQTILDTEIKTCIADIPRPQAGHNDANQPHHILYGKGHKRSYLTYRTPRFPKSITTTTSTCSPIPLSDLEKLGIDPPGPPGPPPQFNNILGMQLIFRVAANPMPEGQPRITAANQFRMAIVNAVAAGNIPGVGPISPWVFIGAHGPANPDSARCDIMWAHPPAEEHLVEQGITLLVHHVNWGGHNIRLLFA